MTDIEVIERLGWEVFRLRSESLEVEVIPGRGGEIATVRSVPLDIDILWRSPAGLQPRGERIRPKDSYAAFIETYPGGWQTIFPNGGNATTFDGVDHGFHGEVWQADCAAAVTGEGLELTTALSSVPFSLRKRISLDADRLTVEESARNVGSEAARVMWVHHPAFGAPFLSGMCRVDAAARAFVTDDARDVGDLAPGSRTVWPFAEGRDGHRVDLRDAPAEGSSIERMGYLTDFERGWVAITNPALRIRAELEWNEEVFPYAWLWIDANGSTGYPTFGDWYVMAIEPASSYPAQGLDAADRKTKTLLAFEPGQERTITVSLTVSRF